MTSLDTKKIIRDALDRNDLDTVASLAQQNKRVISLLIRMTYDKETVLGWRAIKAIGRAAKVLVKSDYEFLRVTVRKLLWSLSDESGGIGWAAPEILGEIVCVDPEKFSDIVPLIAEIYEIEEKVFRPGVVYALASIADISPERVACYQKIIIMALTDKDPLIKIHALHLVRNVWNVAGEKNMWSKEYRDRIINTINNIKNDKGVAILYQNNGFIDIEVGEIVKKELKLFYFNIV